MLQGTFETLSLPEVLGLLASARKSGALWLEAGSIAGVVHLEDGHCHATVAGDVVAPVETGPELLSRLVDLCFAAMCQESGSFRFAAEDPAPWWCPEPVELSDALVEVDSLLKQWREILRVIPSLECRPCLLDALEVDELVVDRERWSLLVAIDGRRTVRELVARSARPVIDVCHVLLELVEAGAIGVIDPAAAPRANPSPRPRRSRRSRPNRRRSPPEVYEPEIAVAEPVPEVAADDPTPAETFEPEPIEAQAEPIPVEPAPGLEPQAQAPEMTEPAPLEPAENGASAEYAEAQPLASVGAPVDGGGAAGSSRPTRARSCGSSRGCGSPRSHSP